MSIGGIRSPEEPAWEFVHVSYVIYERTMFWPVWYLRIFLSVYHLLIRPSVRLQIGPRLLNKHETIKTAQNYSANNGSVAGNPPLKRLLASPDRELAIMACPLVPTCALISLLS
jgi:hypothetical protein